MIEKMRNYVKREIQRIFLVFVVIPAGELRREATKWSRSPSTLTIHCTSMYCTSMELTKDLMGASAAPLILSILSEGESYGYALIQRVRDLSNGEIEWTDGMLYPVLHRLENQGFIKACWRTAENGRQRKYYSLKASGRTALATQRAQWRVVNLTLEQIWGT